VYSAAILEEWRTVEAMNAFIDADVNTYGPLTTADRKEEVRQAEQNAATHGDVRASCTTTTSK